MSARTPTWLLAGGCALTLAYLAGRLQTDAAPTPTAVPAAASPAPRPIVLERAAAPAGLTRDELRAAIREALAEERGAETADPTDERTAPEREARIAEARSVALEVVARGLDDGVWSVEERAALRAQLMDLPERETHEVLTPLFQAINAQRLRLDGPPI
ncbi:MAG: hypothetical protein R3B48_22065 [Kofleriaceae bacterium]